MNNSVDQISSRALRPARGLGGLLCLLGACGLMLGLGAPAYGQDCTDEEGEFICIGIGTDPAVGPFDIHLGSDDDTVKVAGDVEVSGTLSIAGESVAESLSTNAVDIAANKEAADAGIAANKEAIGTNIETIAANKEAADAGIAANKEAIGTNIETIAANKEAADAGIAANKEAIGTNIETIAANKEAADAGIAANKEAIGTNIETIAANKEAADAGIAANKEAIGINMGAITSNTGNIASNMNAIGMNAGNITANSSAIAANAANIAANSAEIAMVDERVKRVAAMSAALSAVQCGSWGEQQRVLWHGRRDA